MRHDKGKYKLRYYAMIPLPTGAGPTDSRIPLSLLLSDCRLGWSVLLALSSVDHRWKHIPMDIRTGRGRVPSCVDMGYMPSSKNNHKGACRSTTRSDGMASCYRRTWIS